MKRGGPWSKRWQAASKLQGPALERRGRALQSKRSEAKLLNTPVCVCVCLPVLKVRKEGGLGCMGYIG